MCSESKFSLETEEEGSLSAGVREGGREAEEAD